MPAVTRTAILKISAGVLAALVMAGGGYAAGFYLGRHYPLVVRVEGVSKSSNPQAVTADFGTFWQAWQLIGENHLRGATVDSQTKVYGAIRGLVGSLGDPYSEFFSPKESQRFQQLVQGNFGGVGIEIGVRSGQLAVIAPLKGTPADRAGLKAGDQILKINASSTDGMTVDEAVSIIRGPVGSPVTLSLLRQGWEKPRDFTLTRATIEIPTLDMTMKGNIVYLQMYGFNANSERLFYEAMVRAQQAGARGMVFDLRNNPGGYLDVAVDLAGWFLPKGTLVVSEQGRQGTLKELKAYGNEALAEFPVVVLINAGSASASEILSGALRDQRHITLVGDQSFGKGTVQEIEDLRDGSSLKLTVAHWVLPSGNILENGGLKPDIEVAMTDEDTKAGRDPQLAKALEVVRQKIQDGTP